MSLKSEFDSVYEMLCDKLYKPGAVSYKEVLGNAKEAEEIWNELVELKWQIDGKLKYATKTICSKLKIKY